MKFSDLRRDITETYIRHITEACGDGGYLVPVFVEFGKLTGDHNTDVRNVKVMQFYSEAAVLSENQPKQPKQPPPGGFELPARGAPLPGGDPFAHIHARTRQQGQAAPEPPIDEKEDCLLRFQKDNDKLRKLAVVTMSLPAGYSCPFADKCRTFATKTGKQFPMLPGQDKPMYIRQPNVPDPYKPGFKAPKAQKYDPEAGFDLDYMRCFAASDEVRKPDTRRLRWSNFDLLRKFKGDIAGMVDLILRSIDHYEDDPKNQKIKLFRIHESGDFYSQEYFDAWLEVSKRRSDIVFYAYTTSIPYWINRQEEVEAQDNFRLIASQGSKHQDLADKHDLRQAIVVLDQGEAIRRDLLIDVDEFIAIFGDADFALLVHNVGPAGTQAAKVGMSNSKLIKQKAAEHDVPASELAELIRKYTTKAIEINDREMQGD